MHPTRLNGATENRSETQEEVSHRAPLLTCAPEGTRTPNLLIRSKIAISGVLTWENAGFRRAKPPVSDAIAMIFSRSCRSSV